MTRYFIAALLALCFVLGGYAYWTEARLDDARKRAEEAEFANRELRTAFNEQAEAKKRSDAALSKRLRAAQAEAQKRKEEHDALKAVLDAARDWSDAPVPSGVADWLRQPAAPGGVRP